MKILGACLSLLVTLTALPAAAHVAFTSPPSGATFVVGEPLTIAWVDTVLHDGVGYDLEASSGPLALGLSTRTHSFVWTPTAPCSPCLLRITQVNAEEDYSAELTVNVLPVEAGGGGGAGRPAVGGAGGAAGAGGTPSSPAGGSASGGAGRAPVAGGAPGGSAPSESSRPGGEASTPPGGEASGGGTASGGAGGTPASDEGEAPPDRSEAPLGGAANDERDPSKDVSCGFGRGGSRGSPLVLLLLGGALRRRPRRSKLGA